MLDRRVKKCLIADTVVLVMLILIGAQLAVAACQPSGYGLCYDGVRTIYQDCSCDSYGCYYPSPPSIICFRFSGTKDTFFCTGNYGYDMSDKLCAPFNSSPTEDCPCSSGLCMF